MKTAVLQASIDCFYGHVQTEKQKSHDRILAVMEPGRAYTGQQLFELTGIVPGSVSARMGELRKLRLVMRSESRVKCPISGQSVHTHRKAGPQMALFS